MTAGSLNLMLSLVATAGCFRWCVLSTQSEADAVLTCRYVVAKTSWTPLLSSGSPTRGDSTLFMLVGVFLRRVGTPGIEMQLNLDTGSVRHLPFLASVRQLNQGHRPTRGFCLRS